MIGREIWEILGIIDQPNIQVNLPIPLSQPRTAPSKSLPYRILVQVRELFSANKNFMGSWHGQLLKCRAYPNANNLTVGDVVVVTRLAHSTEYFYREAGAPEGCLYFSPGYDSVNNNVQKNGELWKYDSDLSSIPTFVWMTTRQFEWITCLFWTDITEMLYIVTAGRLTAGGTVRELRIYECDVTTDTVVEVAGPYCSTINLANCSTANPSGTAVDAAEFGDGKIYISHTLFQSGGAPGEYVIRFDPITYTLERVISSPSPTFGAWMRGGIAVHRNLSRLYCVGQASPDGVAPLEASLFYSTTGHLGTWIPVILTGYQFAGPMVTWRENGKVYFIANTPADGSGNRESHILCIEDDGSLSDIFSVPSLSADGTNYILRALGVRYTGTTPDTAAQFFAVDESGSQTRPMHVYATDALGVPGLDSTFGNEFSSLHIQSLVSSRSRMFGLFGTSITTGPPDFAFISTVKLMIRNGPNDWDIIYSWDEYAGGGCMTVVKTCKFCHEI